MRLHAERHQARQARILQIGIHLTQSWSVWMPPRHGPAPRTSTRKKPMDGILRRESRHMPMRCTIQHIPLSFIYIHSSHVLDGTTHDARLIEPNDCVLWDFNLDSYSRNWKREVDTSCEVLHRESVLDEFTCDNSKIDHILLSSSFRYAHSTDAFKKIYIQTIALFPSEFRKSYFDGRLNIHVPERSHFCGIVRVRVPLVHWFSFVTFILVVSMAHC